MVAETIAGMAFGQNQFFGPTTGWINSRFSRFLVKHICPSSAKSICYFSVCHLSIQPRLNLLSTQQQGGGWRHTGGARPCCCVRRRLSLGRTLNGKHKNSIFSWQRMGIFSMLDSRFFHVPKWLRGGGNPCTQTNETWPSVNFLIVGIQALRFSVLCTHCLSRNPETPAPAPDGHHQPGQTKTKQNRTKRNETKETRNGQSNKRSIEQAVNRISGQSNKRSIE